MQARCKVQGRFRTFRGGLVQARCKVQAGWSGAGQVYGSRQVAEFRGGLVQARKGSGGSGVVQARCKGSRKVPGWSGAGQV